MSYGAGLAVGMDAPPVQNGGKATGTVYVMGLAAMALVGLAIFAGAKDGKRKLPAMRAKYNYNHKKTGWGDLDANVRQAEYGP